MFSLLKELCELLDIRMVEIRRRWQDGRLQAIGFRRVPWAAEGTLRGRGRGREPVPAAKTATHAGCGTAERSARRLRLPPADPNAACQPPPSYAPPCPAARMRCRTLWAPSSRTQTCGATSCGCWRRSSCCEADVQLLGSGCGAPGRVALAVDACAGPPGWGLPLTSSLCKRSR